MMHFSVKSTIGILSFCIGILLVAGCGSYRVIQKQEVPQIPEGNFEQIIKLVNPEGVPERTLAGVVHATGKATVCTDYPREKTIKSLDELTTLEKSAFPYFLKYVIQDGDMTVGYVSIPIGYGAIIWRNDKNMECRYKVQITLPGGKMGDPSYDGADKSMFSW